MKNVNLFAIIILSVFVACFSGCVHEKKVKLNFISDGENDLRVSVGYSRPGNFTRVQVSAGRSPIEIGTFESSSRASRGGYDRDITFSASKPGYEDFFQSISPYKIKKSDLKSHQTGSAISVGLFSASSLGLLLYLYIANEQGEITSDHMPFVSLFVPVILGSGISSLVHLIMGGGEVYTFKDSYSFDLTNLKKLENYAPDDGTKSVIETPSAENNKPEGPLSVPDMEGMVITVMDLTPGNMAEGDSRLISDYLSAAISGAKRYRVIDRSQRNIILDELKFSMSGCGDESCQLEAGKLLAAQSIVVGSVGMLGQRVIFNIKLLEVESGEVVRNVNRVFQSLDELIDALDEIALSL